MENIIEPNESFDFAKLSLAHPTSSQGGAYFTRLQFQGKPLYIQTLKCLTKQGFIKSGKKYYCDLMFDKNAESIVTWFEKLEETCQTLIHAKSDVWFQNPLQLSDIESAFNSTIKIYRSGKFYLVRANVKNNAANEPALKIFTEDETSLSIYDVTQETEMICILEIQGIKFTNRSFNIEIEIKQGMVVHEEPIFESCLIKTPKSLSNKIKKEEESSLGRLILEPLKQEVKQNMASTIAANEVTTSKEDTRSKEVINEVTTSKEVINEVKVNEVKANEEDEDANKQEEDEDEEEDAEDAEEEDDDEDDDEDSDDEENETLTINNDEVVEENELGIEDLNKEEPKEELKEEEDFKELDISSLREDSLETVSLKKPNEVYFKMYKEAREKAKKAKKSLILAYLEAKNIKKTYMLDEMNESDNEFDAEIEETSEKELEGL